MGLEEAKRDGGPLERAEWHAHEQDTLASAAFVF